MYTIKSTRQVSKFQSGQTFTVQPMTPTIPELLHEVSPTIYIYSTVLSASILPQHFHNTTTLSQRSQALEVSNSFIYMQKTHCIFLSLLCFPAFPTRVDQLCLCTCRKTCFFHHWPGTGVDRHPPSSLHTVFFFILSTQYQGVHGSGAKDQLEREDSAAILPLFSSVLWYQMAHRHQSKDQPRHNSQPKYAPERSRIQWFPNHDVGTKQKYFAPNLDSLALP